MADRTEVRHDLIMAFNAQHVRPITVSQLGRALQKHRRRACVYVCEANPGPDFDNTGLPVVEAPRSGDNGVCYLLVAGLEKLVMRRPFRKSRGDDMSLMYAMSVEVSGYRPEAIDSIKEAATSEWPFGDWTDSGEKLSADGEGLLGGGETEREFTERLGVAIWRANGAYCDVAVKRHVP
jgi:hypothetical protein